MNYATARPSFNLNKTLNPRTETMCGTGREHWRISNNKEPFDLYQLIGDFCVWYDRVLDARGYRLTARVSSDLPKFFLGHILMLGFLLWEIASYSLAYFGSENVVLEVQAKSFRDNRCSIYFSLAVQDLGIPQKKEKVPFLPSYHTRKKEMGKSPVSNLYYAEIIAGLLGGKIHILNKRGLGVEYIVEVCLLNNLLTQKDKS